jgi:hypothetical protein
MSSWDEQLETLLNNDEKRFEALLKEFRGELQLLDSLEESVRKEVGKTRTKLKLLIDRMERATDYSQRHFATLRQRNKVWRNRMALPASQVEEEEPAFITINSILKLVMSVSLRDTVRASDFEAQSFSFLLPSVLKRTLLGESQGYILKRQPNLEPIQEEGAELLRSLRETFQGSLYSSPEIWSESLPLVRGWWTDSALPRIFGGKDPDWEGDECYSREYMVQWVNNPESDPIYTDCLEVIRCSKV